MHLIHISNQVDDEISSRSYGKKLPQFAPDHTALCESLRPPDSQKMRYRPSTFHEEPLAAGRWVATCPSSEPFGARPIRYLGQSWERLLLDEVIFLISDAPSLPPFFSGKKRRRRATTNRSLALGSGSKQKSRRERYS